MHFKRLTQGNIKSDIDRKNLKIEVSFTYRQQWSGMASSPYTHLSLEHENCSWQNITTLNKLSSTNIVLYKELGRFYWVNAFPCLALSY